MEISFFKDFISRQPEASTLADIANTMRHDTRLQSITTAYRQTGSKNIKTESPLFAVACRLEGGKSKDNITQLTGLSLVDLDHIAPHADGTKPQEAVLEMKRKAVADPHTLMCYVTISGNGLRIIYRYDIPPELHGDINKALCFYQSAFHVGNAYYERLLGAQADRQCKNINRLSGLAHDPDVFLRNESEAVPFGVEEIDKASTTYARESKEAKQMQRIQTYFDTFIAPQLAADGIEYRSGSHNEYVMRVGYKLAERRFSRAVATRWAVRQFADYADTAQVFGSCFANAVPRPQRHETANTKFASVDEIKAFLDGCISLRYNEITHRTEHAGTADDKKLWQPITDRTVNTLWSRMSTVARVNIQDIYRVIDSDYVPVFNPFADYLDSLPGWHDGCHDFIADLAATVSVKETARHPDGTSTSDIWCRYLKKWLVGMVAGWCADDVVNNVILVLIGEQGAYKTTWFNCLLPPSLKQYFYTKTNANRMSKDDLLTLAQYALVCCEELDTMRPSELNQLKAAVTMPSIDERAAYAHYHEHRKHIASFCGTGNSVEFLSDPTGNRRWLPFEVESISSPRLHPFCHEGIYSQAYALYKSGFRFWFSKEEIQELNRHNRQFETPRLEHELVDLYFRKPQEGEQGEFMSVARALQLISYGISQKLNTVNVARAFVELDFKRVRTNRSRGFIVKCRTAEEMQIYQRRQTLNAESDT